MSVQVVTHRLNVTEEEYDRLKPIGERFEKGEIDEEGYRQSCFTAFKDMFDAGTYKRLTYIMNNGGEQEYFEVYPVKSMIGKKRLESGPAVRRPREEPQAATSKPSSEADMFRWLKRAITEAIGPLKDSVRALHRHLERMEERMSEQGQNLTVAVEKLHGTIEDLRTDIGYTLQQSENQRTELQTALDTTRTHVGELRHLLEQEELDDSALLGKIGELETALSEAQANAASTEAIEKLQSLNASLEQLDATLQQAPTSETPTEPVPVENQSPNPGGDHPGDPPST